jgi:hypothetical protein
LKTYLPIHEEYKIYECEHEYNKIKYIQITNLNIDEIVNYINEYYYHKNLEFGCLFKNKKFDLILFFTYYKSPLYFFSTI